MMTGTSTDLRVRNGVTHGTRNQRRNIIILIRIFREISCGDTNCVQEGVLEVMEEPVMLSSTEAAIWFLEPAGLDPGLTSRLVMAPRQTQGAEVLGLEEVNLVLLAELHEGITVIQPAGGFLL